MSFQTNSVYSQNIPSAITLLAARSALGLALLSGAIALLALVISRTLPDTGAIGFLSWRDGNPDIYLLDLVRGTLHNLTDNGAVNGTFAFAPDGTRIAFESNKDGNTEIYMVNVECAGLFSVCGGIRQLTDNETDSRHPVWSPDGRQIAYVYDVSFEDSDNDIYVLDVEREETRQLTHNPADDNSPAWSADGSSITFRSTRNHAAMSNEYEVYVADGGSSDAHPLAGQETSTREYAWSPDGQWVLLIRDKPYSNDDIALADSNASNLQIITGGSTKVFLSPTWSPDSRRVALIGYAYGTPNTLFILNRERKTLEPLAGDVRYDSPLAWSPDGRFLVYTLSQVPASERADEIGMIDLARGSIQLLTTQGDNSPAWWP